MRPGFRRGRPCGRTMPGGTPSSPPRAACRSSTCRAREACTATLGSSCSAPCWSRPAARALDEQFDRLGGTWRPAGARRPATASSRLRPPCGPGPRRLASARPASGCSVAEVDDDNAWAMGGVAGSRRASSAPSAAVGAFARTLMQALRGDPEAERRLAGRDVIRRFLQPSARTGQFPGAWLGPHAARLVVRHQDVRVGVRAHRVHRHVTLDRPCPGCLRGAADEPGSPGRGSERTDADRPAGLPRRADGGRCLLSVGSAGHPGGLENGLPAPPGPRPRCGPGCVVPG